MAEERPPDGYDVGYGRPPKATQFAPGKSGNPLGRPKGRKTTGAILQDFLSEKVSFTEHGRRRTLTRLQLMLLQLANDAARGDKRALKLTLDIADRYGQSTEGAAQSEELSSDDLAILEDHFGKSERPDAATAPPAKRGGGGDGEGEGV